MSVRSVSPTASRRLIAAQGPIPVSDYMALANAHYYATRDPLGAAGDFITAPEISQMFGELIGLALAEIWDPRRPARRRPLCRARPRPGHVGRRRACGRWRAAGLEPKVHFVETSPILRAAQAGRVPSADWHDDLADRARRRPDPGRRQRIFRRPADSPARRDRRRLARAPRRPRRRPLRARRRAAGSGRRRSPTSSAPRRRGRCSKRRRSRDRYARHLADRMNRHGGAALIVDYGHDRVSHGRDVCRRFGGMTMRIPGQSPAKRT